MTSLAPGASFSNSRAEAVTAALFRNAASRPVCVSFASGQAVVARARLNSPSMGRPQRDCAAMQHVQRHGATVLWDEHFLLNDAEYAPLLHCFHEDPHSIVLYAHDDPRHEPWHGLTEAHEVHADCGNAPPTRLTVVLYNYTACSVRNVARVLRVLRPTLAGVVTNANACAPSITLILTD